MLEWHGHNDFYKALINVVGVQGNVQLDNREVLFLVPPSSPGVN